LVKKCLYNKLVIKIWQSSIRISNHLFADQEDKAKGFLGESDQQELDEESGV
jgi:hypothetical protein